MWDYIDKSIVSDFLFGASHQWIESLVVFSQRAQHHFIPSPLIRWNMTVTWETDSSVVSHFVHVGNLFNESFKLRVIVFNINSLGGSIKEILIVAICLFQGVLVEQGSDGVIDKIVLSNIII